MSYVAIGQCMDLMYVDCSHYLSELRELTKASKILSCIFSLVVRESFLDSTYGRNWCI